MSYIADIDAANPLASLQAASCTYRMALVPRPRLHLIRFHGVLAPHAGPRAAIVPGPPQKPGDDAAHHAHEAPARMVKLRRCNAIRVDEGFEWSSSVGRFP